MKAIFKSMMVVGMMILSTATSFAGNNIDKDKDKHQEPARTFTTGCNLRHMHDVHCNAAPAVDHDKVYPGMNKKMRKHILKRKHHFDKHGHCKKCHYTSHEIHRMEREMHMEPHPHKDVHPRKDKHRQHGDVKRHHGDAHPKGNSQHKVIPGR